MSEDLRTRHLPDGRIELTWGKCIPVIMSTETFRGKTTLEAITLIADLTLSAHALVQNYGYKLPLTTGTFVPDEEVAEGYLLRVPGQRSCSLRVWLRAYPPAPAE